MKFLGQVIVCIALAGASGAAAASAFAPAAAGPSDASYLSFAELYRLTVSGASSVDFNAPPASAAEPAAKPVAVSAGAPQAAPASISISSLPLPEPSSRWLVLASAAAIVAWVARRRLGYSL
ncbi:MAG: hypothetical protein ACM30H_08310 [Clostridia bacterium]